MSDATTADVSRGEPIRVGIAGFGLAGEVFHAPLIDFEPGLDLSAVVTGNEERAGRARSRYPGVGVVESVDELWGGIDLLVVAAPNRFHAELALAAIERDVPVVIDKPMASTLAEAERVLAAGGKVTVFQNRRWDGDFLTVSELVRQGRLGESLKLESRFERFRPEVGDRWRDSGDPADGGGQLSDLGPHLVDQAVQLFGTPSRIYAEVDRRRPGAETDDDAFISLEHAGGERSHIHLGVMAPVPGPRFRLSGTAGGFEVEGLDPQEGQLKQGTLPGSPGFGERGPGRIWLGGGGGQEKAILTGAYTDFYASVPAWVRGEGPPPVDPAQSLEVMRILDCARQSSDSRSVIEF